MLTVRKIVGMIVLGIGGLAAAIALTVGALALAGGDVGQVVQPTLGPSGSSESRTVSETPEDPLSASPSGDDDGGTTSGSDDTSNDDGGSSNSGPGSSNSGSGSTSSGSGSGPDDD